MRPFTTMRRISFFACTIGAVAITPPAIAEETVGARKIEVAPQQLSSALQDFSEQSGLQVAYVATLADNVDSKGTHDAGTAEAALSEILDSTGLEYQFVNTDTVAIGPAPAASNEAADPGNAQAAPSRMVLMAQASETRQVQPTSTTSRANTSGPTGETNFTMEEIDVTAQKREERLMDVPISISVLNGEVLDSSTFTSMNDALRTVPGVVLFEQGQTGLNKLAIRGVSSNPSYLNSSSTVGYYLDELPFAFVRFPLVPDTNAYDLERVEVLRGPQGTLYGANSLNGVVRVVTRDADLNEVEFKTRTTLSSTHAGGESYRGDAALSVPVIPGKLAIRAVAGYADNGGWIDRPLTADKDVNQSVQQNYRLKVNAAPVENLNVELMTWLFRDDRDGYSTALDDRTSAAGIPEGIESEYDAYGLTLSYDFSGVSILSATNHIKFSTDARQNSPAGSTAPLDAAITRIGAELTSQEFRLSSTTSGPWRWTAGTIYRNAKDSTNFRFTSPAIAVGLSGINYNLYASKSFALFGELTKTFFDDRLELTGGARYFEDDTASNELSSITMDPPFGLREDSFDAVTPRIVLSYRPNKATNYYASFAQGFRSGFSQAGSVLRLTQGVSAVRPDRLSNYEIGTKGVGFNGRINYELAAYYIDWEDTVQVVSTLVGPATINSALNTEGVAGPGVDAATTLKLTDRLDFSATVSWNDLEFVEDVLSTTLTTTSVVYPEGARPPESSETTASAAIDYSLALPGQYSGQLTATVNYLSKMSTAASTTAASLAGDDLTIVRSSFTLLAPAGWSAMLFVDNLTDEDGRVRPALPINPLAGSDRVRPRTYGLQLDYRFN